MGETGIIVRFQGNLDPRAQEFIPTNPTLTPFPLPATVFPLPHPFTQPSSPYPYPYFLPPPFHDAPAAVSFPYFTSAAAAPSSAAYGAPPPPPPPPHLSTSPTRSLHLSPLPSDLAVSESSLRRELEVFGDVRGVQMESLLDGIVTVHFYDLRDAVTALTEIRGQHMQHQARLRNHYASLFKARSAFSHASGAPPSLPPTPLPAHELIAGRAMWAQYVIPTCNAVPDGQNQGTVVVFSSDSEVSAENLKRALEPFGPIKELRDTPSKRNQKFVEFYDVRDAAKALKQMNGKEIDGKKVVIEFSRPGGHHSRKSSHSAASTNKKPSPFTPQVPGKYSRRFGASSCLHPSSAIPQLPFKKHSSGGKGTPDEDSGSIEAAMGSMGLGGEDAEQQQHHSGGTQKRNFARKENGYESAEGSVKHQQLQQLVKNRHWKGKQSKKHETRFLIRDDNVVEPSSIDPRTTVMIKNIPNKYSQKLLLSMLDNHCIHCNEQMGDGDDQPLSSYDFVYLPIDFNNKCNVGYGFVNMTSPEATLRLYKAFHLQHWEVFNSRKICEVTYARVQGLEALKEHFKNSKFPCEMDHYLPVVFSPPRDGKALTEPLPIAGNNKQQPIIPINITITPNCCEHQIMASDSASSACACEDVLSSQSGGVGDDDTSDMGGSPAPF